MAALDVLLSRLKKVRKSGEGWVACCPAHQDSTPSLSFTQAADGRLLLHCFAGCDVANILAAVGMEKADLRSETAERKPTLRSFALSRRLRAGALEAHGVKDCEQGIAIEYRERDGSLLFHKYRVKEHGPDHYRADKGSRLVPYGLWRLGDFGEREGLILVEGETDTWTLWQEGYAALGLPGASSAHTLRREHLAGFRRVWIVRERDSAGEGFAKAVGAQVAAWGIEAAVLDLPAKDVSDMYVMLSDEARFRTELDRLLTGEAKSEFRFWRLPELLIEKFPEPRWLVPGILPEGLTLMVGAPKIGKSRMATHIALAVGMGGSVLGEFATQQASVLYLDLEQGAKQSAARFRDLLGYDSAPSRVTVVHGWPTIGDGAVNLLRQRLDADHSIGLVIVDTLAKVWPQSEPKGAAGNAYHREYATLSRIKALADERSISIVLIHHESKAVSPDQLYRASGTMAMTGVPDTILMLSRKRGEREAQLFVTGREVREQTFDLYFDAYLAAWKVDHDALPSYATN